MPKIICLLENAATEINGIKFLVNPDGDGLISDGDVEEPHLSIFTAIPGYSIVEEDKQPDPVKETAAQRKARLKAEQDAADQAAAEQAAKDAEAAAAAAEQAKAAESAAPVVEETTPPAKVEGEIF